MAEAAILRSLGAAGTVVDVDEETGIYRDEVTEIFEALADIKAGVLAILRYIEEADDGEEEAQDV
jgi:hypothetical protein